MSFGEIIPSTWYDGVYKLESDGSDSSGNARDIATLNSPSFSVKRFGAGGMDLGTSGIDKGLRASSLDITGGTTATIYQVSMWFKLNTTSSLNTNACFFMIQHDHGGIDYRQMYSLANISGGNLVIDLILNLVTTPAQATLTVVADTDWHYLSFLVDINTGTCTIILDGKTASHTGTGGLISPGANRVSIGNHVTSSTLQLWASFDQATISTHTHYLTAFGIQRHYAQARGMFCI